MTIWLVFFLSVNYYFKFYIALLKRKYTFVIILCKIFYYIYLFIGLETINSITKNNSNEEPMIVTEEFIRHLEQELRMENTDCTQGSMNLVNFQILQIRIFY